MTTFLTILLYYYITAATAFVAAFGRNNASVALRIHAKWGDLEIIQSLDSFKQFNNIRVSVATVGDNELQELWREADCVVSLSKGEGWGLIPREALSLGIPVMVSDLPCWADLRNHSSQFGGGQGRAHFVPIAGREQAVYAFTAEDTGHFLRVDEIAAQNVFVEIYQTYSRAGRRAAFSKDVSPSWEQVAALM